MSVIYKYVPRIDIRTDDDVAQSKSVFNIF